MNRLTIIGSVNPYGGYGRHLIRAARDIEALTDTRVMIRPLKSHPDVPQWIQERTVNEVTGVHWELIIAPPTVCPTPGKRTVYFTMNETTRLTDASVELLRKADEIIVPNEWNKNVFEGSGCCRTSGFPKIHIVPLGIDHRIFNWRPLPPPSPVVFGTAGSGPRKGIPDVIRAFLEAFPGRNDVRLRIKITTEDEAPDVVDSRIDVVRANYTDEQMADWYASLHCFVSASRGEGWNLMQQEAVVSGKAIISWDLGGMSEWIGLRPVRDELGHDEASRLVDAPSPYVGKWLNIHPYMIRAVMKHLADNPPIRSSYSSMCRASEFTWDRSSAELIRVLTEVGAIGEKPFMKNVYSDVAFGMKLSPEYIKLRDDLIKKAEISLGAPQYYHSGNLGDIIYGLYAMREHCGERGAELIVGPCQHQTGAHSIKAPITKQQFDMLLPLLKTQVWIKRVRWSQFYPIAEDVHDMNGFRKLWPRRHTLGIKTLCEAQFEHLGIREGFDPAHAWLGLQPSWQGTNLPRVVIHRSARWRQDDQMWRKLVNAYREKLLFVGTADEYFEFENTYGAVSFWKVRDFLEMAEIITFAIGFVGNQSFPMALAIGFGQNVFQEQSLATPDCAFDRPGSFWTQKDDMRAVLKGWLE